jgi:hypothetical protein
MKLSSELIEVWIRKITDELSTRIWIFTFLSLFKLYPFWGNSLLQSLLSIQRAGLDEALSLTILGCAFFASRSPSITRCE